MIQAFMILDNDLKSALQYVQEGQIYNMFKRDFLWPLQKSYIM